MARRFLTTVERHLKNVTYGIGFQVVIETLPPLMNALRMVWIVSKHYNTDEKVNQLNSSLISKLRKGKVR